MLFPCFVDAKSLNDYYNELAKLQKEYKENKNNKELTQSQMKQLNTDINNINASITKTRNEIKQAEQDIEVSKGKINDKKKIFFFSRFISFL